MKLLPSLCSKKITSDSSFNLLFVMMLPCLHFLCLSKYLVNNKYHETLSINQLNADLRRCLIFLNSGHVYFSHYLYA